jgi:hypothetical protein
VVYFLVGAPLIAGGHYYLWSRLIRNVGFTLPTERALTALLCEHLATLGMRVLRHEHVAHERSGSVLHMAGIDDYVHDELGSDVDDRGTNAARFQQALHV